MVANFILFCTKVNATDKVGVLVTNEETMSTKRAKPLGAC